MDSLLYSMFCREHQLAYAAPEEDDLELMDVAYSDL